MGPGMKHREDILNYFDKEKELLFHDVFNDLESKIDYGSNLIQENWITQLKCKLVLLGLSHWNF